MNFLKLIIIIDMENVSAAFLQELREEGTISRGEGPRETTRVPVVLKKSSISPGLARLVVRTPPRSGWASFGIFLAPKLML